MKNPPVVQKLQVRYQDLDPYGHVNNAVHPALFEMVRLAYWRALADVLGLDHLEAGDLPGARYVIAEMNVRYKAPIFLDTDLLGAATVRSVGNRSYTMDFELRFGETFEDGKLVTEGFAAHVFYDPEVSEVRPRPEWFLPAVAELEGRPEESFTPEKRRERSISPPRPEHQGSLQRLYALEGCAERKLSNIQRNTAGRKRPSDQGRGESCSSHQ